MEQETEIDYTIKLLIVGDSSVGKSNFIYRFIEDSFCEDYLTTSGIDLKTANMKIKDKMIRVQLWDTAGQEKYRAITKNLFLKVLGALVFFDITNENSFYNVKDWVKSIKEECGGHMQMILIGNKNDLEDKRVVKKDVAEAYAREQKIDYMETSSKTGENVQEAIISLCEKILKSEELSKDVSFTLDKSSFCITKKKKCC